MFLMTKKVAKTKGTSYFRIKKIFKGYISEITTTLENFGLHSLRSGGASSSANNGVSDRLISKQSRWSSEKVKNGDIKDSVNKRLTVSNTLGLWKTFKAVKKMSDNYFPFDSPVTNQYNSREFIFCFIPLFWQLLIRTEINFPTVHGQLEIVFRMRQASLNMGVLQLVITSVSVLASHINHRASTNSVWKHSF